MNYAYVICTEERGPGSYARMKTHMVSHVETARRTMFRAAVDVVKAQLTSMCRQVDDNLMGVTEELYEKVERDYVRHSLATPNKIVLTVCCRKPFS